MTSKYLWRWLNQMINKLTKINYDFLTSKGYFEDVVKVSTEINNWNVLNNKKIKIRKI
jgi:hypothetical protein